MDNALKHNTIDKYEVATLMEFARLCGQYGVKVGNGDMESAFEEWYEMYCIWGSEDKEGPILDGNNEGYFIEFIEPLIQKNIKNGVNTLKEMIEKMREVQSNHLEEKHKILQLDITKKEIERIKQLQLDFEGRIIGNDILLLKNALIQIGDFIENDKKTTSVELNFWEECVDSFHTIVDTLPVEYDDENSDQEHYLHTFVRGN
ncbi:hypothetical protein CN918_27035 [Priestia megaterium]|nr:hypothetical protein CN918_27035 [Priestia megaterium]